MSESRTAGTCSDFDADPPPQTRGRELEWQRR
jgi:hypothetical protein